MLSISIFWGRNVPEGSQKARGMMFIGTIRGPCQFYPQKRFVHHFSDIFPDPLFFQSADPRRPKGTPKPSKMELQRTMENDSRSRHNMGST